jgi:CDGSH-type Zn-finger protein
VNPRAMPHGGAAGAASPAGQAVVMADVEIKVRASGPYLVRGPIVLRDADGNEFDLKGQDTIALCRCGGSTTKPFCDGTHSKLGFLAATKAVEETE